VLIRYRAIPLGGKVLRRPEFGRGFLGGRGQRGSPCPRRVSREGLGGRTPGRARWPQDGISSALRSITRDTRIGGRAQNEQQIATIRVTDPKEAGRAGHGLDRLRRDPRLSSRSRSRERSRTSIRGPPLERNADGLRSAGGLYKGSTLDKPPPEFSHRLGGFPDEGRRGLRRGSARSSRSAIDLARLDASGGQGSGGFRGARPLDREVRK
jgi:hypothetical protein